MNLPSTPKPRRLPEWASRSVLLDFVRAWAPDLRIRKVRLDDGRRGCGARFTFRGEVLEAEALEADDVKDPDDAIVRRCAWLIYRRLGIPTRLDDAQRRKLEQNIVEARMRGDGELADKLGLELALLNEGQTPVTRMRTRFER